MRCANKKTIITALILALGLFLVWLKIDRAVDVIVDQEADQEVINQNPINGVSCDNYQRRPIAVILASDPEARPLSSLSQADLIIEMPVITGSITRMMAIYVCQDPAIIGSVRSARHDFIPLAQGFDAIFAHWGGSHYALDKLKAKVTDNIDALTNPYKAYYQDWSLPQPHNGFTSMARLVNAATKLGYSMDGEFEGYLFTKDESQNSEDKVLRLGYSYPHNVSYQYVTESNSYMRYRTNYKEIDAINGQQIKAKNVVVMRVSSVQIEGPYYNDLDLEGTGECQVYQNGIIIDCYWQKSEAKPYTKLKFLDIETDKEISFVPGQIWIEIVEPYQKVTWE